MEYIELEDISGLPPECDDLTLEVTFEYHASYLGGSDHPDELEGVEIMSIESDDLDLMYLMDTHKDVIEAATLEAYKGIIDYDDIEF